MDEEVVEVGNIENVCRLCLSTDKPRLSIFTESADSATPLVTKIEACLAIQISTTDKLSTLICADCVNNVNQWHTYKESCLHSQEKLHEWLANQLQSNPVIVMIKDEPMDFDYDNNVEVISDTSFNLESHCPSETENDKMNNKQISDIIGDNLNNDKHKDSETISVEVEISTDKIENQTDKQNNLTLYSIKSEPQDDYDTDCTIEIESVTGSELLLNPMAVSTENDTVMEADSTQKHNTAGVSTKKKMRRGPHTHFRGMRAFKQKCVHCQKFLHSKHSYMKHMKRFHSTDNNSAENLGSQNDDEEMVEDLEDELVNMEKNSPLTEVQHDIISQLKTFSCYSCEQTFNDRRTTLSHVRQHLPDLRSYTCIACLTEFSDRSMYQLHCGASFECAMKIALVIPKYGTEKYFTCNMCLRPMQSRKELLNHLSKHSDKQYEEMMSTVRSPPKLKRMVPLPSPKNDTSKTQTNLGPYKNGDPEHNHMCDLCGMIYRYRPNMLKHRKICVTLRPQERVSYKCAHCYMTFLVFQKFHSHITVGHKKKDFTCAVCNSKFRSPSDYLTHQEKHRNTRSSRPTFNNTNALKKPSQNTQTPLRERNIHEIHVSPISTRMNTQKYGCALCTQEFGTRAELSEHRNVHLKVKIYSCSICYSMFSSAGSLEIHMKDHGIEDPKERNANISCVEYGTLKGNSAVERNLKIKSILDQRMQSHKCEECGKVLSSFANYRRHAKIAHWNKSFKCVECKQMFKSKQRYELHMQVEHDSSKNVPPKSNFNKHLNELPFRTQSGGYACDICNKIFAKEVSLNIHKGWHNRASWPMATRFVLDNNESSNDKIKDSSAIRSGDSNLELPARARKSLPNPPSLMKSPGNFQCQVCNDKFNDVTELRSHLWDVHCARNKQEKTLFSNELQCELCTNVFPDKEILEAHTRWHNANPIFINTQKKFFSCDVCGKSYSSRKILWKHKMLHKNTVVASLKFQSLAKKPMASRFLCMICRTVFSSKQTLRRHKLNFHRESQKQHLQQSCNNYQSEYEPDLKRVKLEINTSPKSSSAMDFPGVKKKTFMCHLCKKIFPNMSVLYKHRQIVHKPRIGKDAMIDPRSISTQDKYGKYSCTFCHKKFPGMSNLRQHFAKKHKNFSFLLSNIQNYASSTVPKSGKTPKLNHNRILFSCKLCSRHVFNKEMIIDHIVKAHTIYQADSGVFYRETDLSIYEVKNAVDTVCPQCNVKYPNNKALKIHYVKFHEDAN